HHRDQALAAGQHPGLGVGVLGEQPDRFVQGGGGGVVKRRWFQRRPPEYALSMLPCRVRPPPCVPAQENSPDTGPDPIGRPEPTRAMSRIMSAICSSSRVLLSAGRRPVSCSTRPSR